jgi:two-component system cell cycle sensor histidine kinase/response regulator CckA
MRSQWFELYRIQLIEGDSGDKMGEPLRVLLVEDSETDAKLVIRELKRSGFEPEVERVETAATMKEALDRHRWDIVLSDFTMPAFSAPAAFNLLKAQKVDIPFIIVSGTVGEETAVQAMRLGVSDYVLKGKMTRLGPVIERELRECRGRAASRNTDQKLQQIEEQLRQAQKMEAIGRLAGGVAHDFNNVLSVILGYTRLVLESLQPDAPFQVELDEVCRAAESGAQLTRQLLAFSRQQVLELRSLNLNDLVWGMEKMLRRLLGEDLDFSIVAAPMLAKVHADPGQIEQIVMNLIVNARDAMPNGGRLTLETSNVQIDERHAAEHPGSVPGAYAVLSVIDNGVGMNAATKARIFEPFFTTKERGKGTGLGLATVFGIVSQSQGHIEVESELGKGTTFKVYLPKRETNTGLTLPPPPTSVSLRGSETILLVEDEERVRKMMCTILRRNGYNVIDATNGDEAVRISHKHAGNIHLLVTDVIMPLMGGPELAERLNASRPDTKVLFLSGYTENAQLVRGARSSRAAFLQKPVTPEALARKIREILDTPSNC